MAKFFRWIRQQIGPVFWLPVNAEALLKLDPERITADDVMAVLGCRPRSAEWVLKTAVRQERFAHNDDGTYRLIDRGTHG